MLLRTINDHWCNPTWMDGPLSKGQRFRKEQPCWRHQRGIFYCVREKIINRDFQHLRMTFKSMVNDLHTGRCLRRASTFQLFRRQRPGINGLGLFRNTEKIVKSSTFLILDSRICVFEVHLQRSLLAGAGSTDE